MSRTLFGTDGMRARFGDEPLTESTVRKVGAALGRELTERGTGASGVFLGGDTRASTPRLTQWVVEGLASAGVAATDLGVVPTPAVAWWTPRSGAAAGVVISASHNPAEDNGIKLLDANGFKWTTAAEAALERRIAVEPEPDPATRAAERPRLEPDATNRYLRWLADEAGGSRAAAGLRIALDTANGAASALAGPLFRALGAETTVLHDGPDGTNINRGCGSTAPQALIELVRRGEFDLGFAFDGDADRCLLVDANGELRDGDAMLFLWASDLQRRGQLAVPRIVATTMSNLGLERALAGIGISVERCDVGDREVVDSLRRNGLRLGGEQSGHLVDLHRTTTGDGLLTAALLAGIVARTASPVSSLLGEFRRFPQVLLNVPVRSKPPLASLAPVNEAVREAESKLGVEGRLVLRYSGTEPLARVMIEGPDESTIRDLAGAIAAAIAREIGAKS